MIKTKLPHDVRQRVTLMLVIGILSAGIFSLAIPQLMVKDKTCLGSLNKHNSSTLLKSSRLPVVGGSKFPSARRQPPSQPWGGYPLRKTEPISLHPSLVVR